MSGNRNDRGWTRRDALAAGGAALGSLMLGRTAAAARLPTGSTANPYAPFEMGIQSYSLRGLGQNGHPDLARALEATRRLGLHYWEAFPAHIPVTTDPAGIAARKRQFKAAGVTLVGYGVVGLGKDEKADREHFEFARAMGIKYLSASPAPGSFDKLDKLVEEYDVAIGIHNHGPGDHFAKIATIEKAIKDHHPKIGCCIDTGHFLRSREDPVHAAEVFGKRIFGVHLKDVKDAKMFTVLGSGDLRTMDLLKVLARHHYAYGLALEYEEHPEDPINDIEECLDEVRKAIFEMKEA